MQVAEGEAWKNKSQTVVVKRVVRLWRRGYRVFVHRTFDDTPGVVLGEWLTGAAWSTWKATRKAVRCDHPGTASLDRAGPGDGDGDAP